MAKQKGTSSNKTKNKNSQKATSKKKSKIFNWQLYLVLTVLVVAVGVFYSLEQPPSEELDLSVIEQGENVVVQIHDPG